MTTTIFPTVFAQSLGEQCKLLEKHQHGMDHVKYAARTIMMQSFQQMAMAVVFDDCLIAFHCVRITSAQKKILKIIHKSTRPWALGNAAAILLEKLEDSVLTGRDAKDITIALVEYLDPGDKKSAQAGATSGNYTVHATLRSE